MSNDKIVQLSPDKIKFSTVDDAITAIRNGDFIVVADDEGRENEGDLICAASAATPAMINFMVREARGLVCVAMPAERAEALDLYPMVADNTDPQQTAFTVSVDAISDFGVTTGISAADRSTTIQCLVRGDAVADDFNRPGHIFPLLSKQGGVLRRVGHTEAAIDFARLAGLPQMGVICEILNDDGTMARRDDLAAFAKKHDIPFVTIAQLIQYRMERERFVLRKIVKEVETKYGAFTAVGYKDVLSGVEHLALVKGSLDQLKEVQPPVRVQHENVLLEILGESDEENAQTMAASMSYINNEGAGVMVCLRSQDGTAHSLLGTLKAYGANPRSRRNANNNDLRDYGIGAQILADLGVKQFRMITNNPKNIVALRGFGLDVTDTVNLTTGVSQSAPKKIEAPVTAAKPEEKSEETREEKREEKLQEKPEVKFAPQNENVKQQAPTPNSQVMTVINDAFKAEEKAAEAPRMMRMGGQIISNQALFEG